MPDIIGTCNDCNKKTPSQNLHRVKTSSEVKVVCGACRVKYCEHEYPEFNESPQGRPVCPGCGKIMKKTEQSGQTSLERFEA